MKTHLEVLNLSAGMRKGRMAFTWLVVCALMPAALNARRIEASYSFRYKNCVKGAKGVTLIFRGCAAAEFKIWDDQLNADYRFIMSKLSATKRIPFRMEERSWLTRRDTECVKQRDSQDGGSLGDILYTQCVLDTTIARSQYVRSLKAQM